MPIQQQQKYCEACSDNRLFERVTPNHVMHLIITLFSCSIWLIPWLLIWGFHDYRWRCKTCGSFPGLTPEEKQAKRNRQIASAALAGGFVLVVAVIIGVGFATGKFPVQR